MPPASSARIASSPVPADGSSTTSAGVIAAASARHETERNRRLELLEASRSLRSGGYGSAEGRRSWPASAAWRPAMRRVRASPGRTCAGTAPSPLRRRRRPVFQAQAPEASEAPKAAFHRGAQDRRIDATTTFEMRKQKLRGPADRGRSACDIGSGLEAARMRRQKRRCMSWK